MMRRSVNNTIKVGINIGKHEGRGLKNGQKYCGWMISQMIWKENLEYNLIEKFVNKEKKCMVVKSLV